MLQLEDRLQDRFPRWFRGRRADVVRPLLRTLTRWSRLDRIDTFLDAHADLRDLDFVRAGLDFLQVRYAVDESDSARIPATGRLVIVANHPSGAIDAFALLDAVGQVRRDVKIVANDFLTAIEPIRGLLLPVRILGGRPGSDSLRAIEAALQREECVIVFPAGEVSRMSPRGIRDGRWRRGFLKFARGANAPVLPMHVKARNSMLFYGTSAMFRPAATALLAREMFTRRNDQVRLRVGETMTITHDADAATVMRDVRNAVYALARRAIDPAATPAMEPLAESQSPEVIAAAVQSLELLGSTSDGKEIRIGRLVAGCALLDEVGRLRELTFRMVGEGTGKRLDLDLYDTWYEHIVLWDAQAAKIAGAYRIARGARVLAERGLQGLYTASLFDYRDAAIPRLAQGMELGRSFVAAEYWNSRSLDYLWQGIGAYLQRHVEIRYLFGPVSISAALPVQAREQLVAYYSRFFGGLSSLATSRRPFSYFAAPPEFGDLDGDTAFKVLKANLDALGTQVPVLYKQYTDLCEPGGARFLAFGVDPDFSNSVDGLIEVDLHCLRAKKRQRYLGAVAPATA